MLGPGLPSGLLLGLFYKGTSTPVPRQISSLNLSGERCDNSSGAGPEGTSPAGAGSGQGAGGLQARRGRFPTLSRTQISSQAETLWSDF